jgi:hypothetical protein
MTIIGNTIQKCFLQYFRTMFIYQRFCFVAFYVFCTHPVFCTLAASVFYVVFVSYMYRGRDPFSCLSKYSVHALCFVEMSNNDALRATWRGYRMPKAPGTPDFVYRKMLECWSRNADKRPSFVALYEYFDLK